MGNSRRLVILSWLFWAAMTVSGHELFVSSATPTSWPAHSQTANHLSRSRGGLAQHLEDIQDFSTMRAYGASLGHLSADLAKYLESGARQSGLSIESYLVRVTGLARSDAVIRSPDVMVSRPAGRRQQFESIMDHLGPDMPVLIQYAVQAFEQAGGRITYAPQQLPPGVFAQVQLGVELRVGDAWVDAAARNPETAVASLAHELLGHEAYGACYTERLVSSALERLGLGGSQLVAELVAMMSYPETEIYAEMQEAGFGRAADDPEQDIVHQLHKMTRYFGEPVARAVVQGMHCRFVHDPLLSETGRLIFARSVAGSFSDLAAKPRCTVALDRPAPRS